jgi:hypothetical protein
LQTPWEGRKVFVDALETCMLDWEIGVENAPTG